MLDKNGRLTFANDFLLKLTGWKREEAIGQDWFDNFLPDDVRKKVKKMFYETLDTGVFPLSYQNEIITKDGELRLIGWSNIIHQDNKNKTYAVTSIGEDITERKKAEKKLRDSHNQLRSLAERLQLIREEERATVAREIHDDLGQVLTALKMDISSLQRKSNVEPSELTDRTDKMLELVNSSIQTVKRIATELRPGILDDLGLFSAIEWLFEEFQNRTKIKCKLDIEGEMDLIDDEVSIAVFRIFQETITNITRHSRASHTEVKISCFDNELMMEVEDNGKGISVEELDSSRSLGIIGMRERVNILRGEFEVSGDPGKGTKVHVKIPLRKKEIV
jgi:PAS domain S-box-containing protein